MANDNASVFQYGTPTPTPTCVTCAPPSRLADTGGHAPVEVVAGGALLVVGVAVAIMLRKTSR